MSSRLYYVRIAAFNPIRGSGDYVSPVPMALIPTVTAPLAPTLVSVSVIDTSSARVDFSMPVSVGGAQLSKFVIGVDIVDSFDSEKLILSLIH